MLIDPDGQMVPASLCSFGISEAIAAIFAGIGGIGAVGAIDAGSAIAALDAGAALGGTAADIAAVGGGLGAADIAAAAGGTAALADVGAGAAGAAGVGGSTVADALAAPAAAGVGATAPAAAAVPAGLSTAITPAATSVGAGAGAAGAAAPASIGAPAAFGGADLSSPAFLGASTTDAVTPAAGAAANSVAGGAAGSGLANGSAIAALNSAPPAVAGGEDSGGFLSSIFGGGDGAGSGIGAAIKGYGAPAISALGLGYDVLKSNTPLPGQTALNTEAVALSTQGTQLESYLQNGTLPPGVQSSITQAADSAKAAIRSRYASMGGDTSAMEQDLANVDTQAATQGATIATQLLQQGVSETQLSSQLYGELLNLSVSQNAALGQGIAGLASALSPNKVTLNIGGT